MNSSPVISSRALRAKPMPVGAPWANSRQRLSAYALMAFIHSSGASS